MPLYTQDTTHGHTVIKCVNLINQVIFWNKLHIFLPASTHSSNTLKDQCVSHLNSLQQKL